MPLHDLASKIDETPFIGLAVTNVHTGYNASIEFEDGAWSPHEFGETASAAILKAIRLHAPVPVAAPTSAAVTRVVVLDPDGVVAPLLSPPPY